MDKELLINNIKKWCNVAGIKQTVAFREAGVGKSFVSHIRDGQMPSVAKVADLAAYLGVSTSDLIGDNHQEPQQAIAEVWARLDEVDRAQVLGFAKGLANAEKYIKTVPDSQTAV